LGGISSPPPFQQGVTRLWSKGAVVKEINAVPDESAKKRPPKHIMGLGLRKSPPKFKSPTNSVAAAASTLIYQKNYVDGNSGNSGGNGGKSDLYGDVLEVDSSSSDNSEDSDEYEHNANDSEDNESDAASGAKVDEGVAPEGLVYSDDEAYLFEVDSDDEFRTSFPKDLVRKNIIAGGPTKPDVTNMTEATAKITMKSIQAMSTPEDDLRFCPSWSAANKKGRPKKNERIKSVMDHIEESANKKRKRKVKYFCKICHRFNRNTQDCWKNTNN
jgi:hypothetical protein